MDKYVIELTITPEPTSDPIEIELTGCNLAVLQREFASVVSEACNKDGYNEGVVCVEVVITKNDEYYDRDEGEFDLAKGLFLL